MLKIIGHGNLLTDPELKEVKDGKKVCTFGVASNRPGREEPDIINIETWGPIAENCAAFLKKGSGVAICGDYCYEPYTNKDGEKRFAVKCKNADVQFTDKKPKSEN